MASRPSHSWTAPLVRAALALVLFADASMVAVAGSTARDRQAAASASHRPHLLRRVARTDVSGSIASDTTWTLAGSPYVVTGDVTVNNGVTLTVAPGVEVRFDGNYALTVRGTLDAEGTASQPIHFTSNLPEPAPGDWAFLDLRSDSSDSVLRHAVIEYGGNASRRGVNCIAGAMCVNTSSIELDQSTVQRSATRGLVLSQSDASITGNTFHGNADEGICLYSCNLNVGPCRPSISGNTFTNNASAISFDGAQDPGLSDNQASENDVNGILLATTQFQQDNVWEADLTYVVPGWCNVGGYGPVRVTIEPGAVIKIDGGGLEIKYSAVVTAAGTAELPITFTSIADDSVGGDTNNDGDNTTPGVDDYYHVSVGGSDATGLFEHTAFRYGGRGGIGQGPVVLGDWGGTITMRGCEVSHSEVGVHVRRGANLTLEDSSLHETSFAGVKAGSDGEVLITGTDFVSATNGVTVEGGRPVIERCVFHDNDVGVNVRCTTQFGGECAPVVSPYNEFEGASQVGVRNEYPVWVSIDARYNWWGDASGPYHPFTNPGGTGNEVDDSVHYAPWLEEFNWLTPQEPLLHGTESLRWALIGRDPDGLSVDVSAGGLGIYHLGSGLEPSEAWEWDTTTAANGRYELKASWLDGTSAVVGEATRDVAVNNAPSLAWHGGIIDGSETWPADLVHVVEEDLTIAAEKSLTMAPGAVVKFVPGVGVTIGTSATLTALGTGDEPIVLTALADDSVGGDINLDGDDSVPHSGDWLGITTEGSGQFVSNEFVDLRYAVTGHAGPLAGDETWSADLVHHVLQEVTVPDGTTLTLEPGTMVKFSQGNGITVQSDGELHARGSVARPIYLSSLQDDALAGDTNGDGSQSVAGIGDWRGILVDGGQASLDHVVMTYGAGSASGGWESTAAGVALANGGTASVSNSRITEGLYEGIIAWGSGEATVTNTVIAGMDRGVNADGSSVVSLTNCVLHANAIGIWGHGGDLILANTVVADSLQYGIDNILGSIIDMRYSNVWSTQGGDYYRMADQTGINGNLSVEPAFKDPSNGNYRLQFGSPMIDAADGTLAPTTDVMSAPRYDDPRTANTGLPTAGGAYADMGAYEFVENAVSEVDLIASHVSGPTDVLAGDTVIVDYTVTYVQRELASHGSAASATAVSEAEAAAVGPWHDTIQLVSEFDGSTIEVDDVLADASLGPGQSAAFEASVTVPGGTSGPYRWQLGINSQGEVFEGLNWNNNTAQAETSTELDVPALSSGVPVEDSFGAVDQATWFKLAQPADEALDVALDAQSGSGHNVIYAGFGRMPSPQRFDRRSAAWNSPDALLSLPAASQARTVYLRVKPDMPPGFDLDFTIVAQPAAFALKALGVTKGSHAGTVTVPLYGSQFGEGLAARLSPVDGASDITAGAVRVVDSSIALATFDMTGTSPGVADVIVEQDGQVAQLDDAFAIVSGAAGQLVASLLVPEAVRVGRFFKGRIEYGNNGGSDLPASILLVEIDGSGSIWLDGEEDEGRNFLQVLAVAPDRPSGGVLGPAEKHTLGFRALISSTSARFDLYSKDGDATDPVDWEAMRLTMRGPEAGMVWDDAWSAMAAEVGSTYGDLIHALAEAADEARAYGIHTNLVGELLNYMVSRKLVELTNQMVGGTLYGLEDGELVPYAGHQVMLQNVATGDERVVRTWHDGRFGFWDAGPGTYTLTVPNVLTETWGVVTVPASGNLTGLEIVVDPGAQLRGRVVSALSGQPLPGAAVTAKGLLSGRAYLAETDARGVFVIGGIQPDLLEVAAVADMYVSSETQLVDLIDPRDATLLFSLGSGGGITGRVLTPDDTPVAGAQVTAGLLDGQHNRHDLTDEEGRYTIEGLPRGTYVVVASAPGFAPGSEGAVTIQAGATTDAVDITLVDGGAVAGSVTDADTGLPLANAEVWADHPLAGRSVLTTTAGGNYTLLDLLPGQYGIAFAAAGYRTEVFTATILTGAITALHVALQPAGSITGLVERSGGGVVSGVPVSLLPSYGPGVTVITSGSGTFSFMGVPDGDYSLMVGDGTGPSMGWRSVKVAEGSRVDVTLALNYAEVSGTVFEQDGTTPVASTTVYLLWNDQVIDMAATEASGRYRFLVMRSSEVDVLTVGESGRTAWRQAVAITPGADRTDQDLILGGCSLSINVTAGGEAVAYAVLELQPTGLSEGEDVLHRPSSTCEADAGGVCQFSALRAADYRLIVRAPGLARTQQVVTVGGAETVDVGLVEACTISGFMRDDEGEAVAGIVSAVDAEGGEGHLAIADDAGSYVLDMLPADVFDLWFFDGRHRAHRVVGVELTGTTAQTLDTVLVSSGAALSGTVRNEAGAPLVGATVMVMDGSGTPLQTAAADAAGRYVLRPLPIGALPLRVRAVGYVVSTTTLTTSSPITYVQDFDLGDPVGMAAMPLGPEAAVRATSGESAGSDDGHLFDFMDMTKYWRPPIRSINDDDFYSYYDLPPLPDDCDPHHYFDRCKQSAQMVIDFEHAWRNHYHAIKRQDAAEVGHTVFKGALIGAKAFLTLARLAKYRNQWGEWKDIDWSGIPEEVQANLDTILAILEKAMVDEKADWWTYVPSVLAELETWKNKWIGAGGKWGGKAVGIYNMVKDFVDWSNDMKKSMSEMEKSYKAYDNAQELYIRLVSEHRRNLRLYRATVESYQETMLCPPPNVPPPVSGPRTTQDRIEVGGRKSDDPNDKQTVGYGPEGWITGDSTILYTIRFENVPTATAAAQSVLVTDQLDPNLDWSTFHLEELGFNKTVAFATAGSPDVIQSCSEQVYVPTDPNPVEVSAGLDPETGLVTWEMRSFDPATGDWPEDQLAGFLPPNDEDGRGEGYAIFSIRPQPGLVAGTAMTNQARIVFDVNPPIDTNVVTNTIDDAAPTSTVSALPATSPASVRLMWSGDDGGGSGVAFHTIYVSTDGGPFVLWQDVITRSSSTFAGEVDRTYAFYSIATDNVGHREGDKAEPEAVTTTVCAIYLPLVLRQ